MGSWEKATVTVLPPVLKGTDPPGPVLVLAPPPPPQDASNMLASTTSESRTYAERFIFYFSPQVSYWLCAEKKVNKPG